MLYVESPETYNGNLKSIFLAGGITGCRDWQMEMVVFLSHLDIAIFNPRRKNFPIQDPSAAEKQIKWEHEHLTKTNFISFWFCPETLNPIVLYELGYWITSDKTIFIGVDPDYQRRQDVEIQSSLVRPNLEIVYSVLDLTDQICKYFSQ